MKETKYEHKALYRFLKTAAIHLAVAAVFSIYTFFLKCPVKMLTGISCPGCGLTRAYLAVLDLDFIAAFGYHPLFWLIPTSLLVYIHKGLIIRLSGKAKKAEKAFDLFIIAVLLVSVAIYLFRMLTPSDGIVAFTPESGLIFRLIQALTRAT